MKKLQKPSWWTNFSERRRKSERVVGPDGVTYLRPVGGQTGPVVTTSTYSSVTFSVPPPEPPAPRALPAAKPIRFVAQQASSPLFKLPTEIRIRIYEYVVGSGWLHVVQRRAKRHEKHSIPFPNTDAYEEPQFWRFTYATCTVPQDWSELMALSKVPAAIPAEFFDQTTGELPPDAKSKAIMKSHDERHIVCDAPSFEFGSGCYAMACFDDDGSFLKIHHTVGDRCDKCNKLADGYSRKYGNPDRGLKRVHAGSALDLRFLLTCRRVHDEAADLPFQLYTFAVANPLHIRELKRHNVLSTRQLGAIESIYLHGDTVSHAVYAADLYALVRMLPELRHLKIWRPETMPLEGRNNEWNWFFETKNLESIEVVTGYDQDRTDTRAAHRKHSEAVEKFLSCKRALDAEQVADDFEGRPDDVKRTERHDEYPLDGIRLISLLSERTRVVYPITVGQTTIDPDMIYDSTGTAIDSNY